MPGNANWAALVPILGLQNGTTNPAVGDTLVWNGTNWVPSSQAPSGGNTPSGPAGGGLSGTYPNPEVVSAGGPAGGSLAGTYPDPTLNSIITPGTFTNPTITVGADGRLTAASDGSSGGVTGPPFSVDGDMAVFNGTSGGAIKDYGLTPDALLLSAKPIKAGSLEIVDSVTEDPIGYPGGGTIQIRFDLGAYDAIHLGVAASFSPAGSTGIVAGRRQILDLDNVSGGSLALTWPVAWNLANGALPTTLAAGQCLRVVLYCTNALETGIVASYFGGGVNEILAGANIAVSGPTGNVTVSAPNIVTQLVAGANITLTPSGGQGIVEIASSGGGGGGGVSSVGTAGRGILASPNPITGAGTINGFDANTFNVKDYGALGDGSTDDTAAINSAITAFEAFASGGTQGVLYFPQGTYITSSQLSVSVTTLLTCTIRGNGRFSSIIKLTGSGGTSVNILEVTNLQSSPVEIADLGFTVGTSGQIKAALYINAQTSSSDETDCGITVVNCNFKGSMLFGVYGNAGWKWNFLNLNGFGGNTAGNYSNSSITSAFIAVAGGTNIIITHVYGYAYQCGIAILPSGGVPGAGFVAQGVIAANCICVQTNFGFYLAPGGTTDASNAPSAYQLMNFLVDQGNYGPGNLPAGSAAYYFDCTPYSGYDNARGQIIMMGCFFTQDTGGLCGIYLKNASQVTISTCISNSNTSANFAELVNTAGTTNYQGALITGCQLQGGAISTSGGASYTGANNS